MACRHSWWGLPSRQRLMQTHVFPFFLHFSHTHSSPIQTYHQSGPAPPTEAERWLFGNHRTPRCQQRPDPQPEMPTDTATLPTHSRHSTASLGMSTYKIVPKLQTVVNEGLVYPAPLLNSLAPSAWTSPQARCSWISNIDLFILLMQLERGLHIKTSY